MKIRLTNTRVQAFLDDPATPLRTRLYDTGVQRFHVLKLTNGGYFYLAYKSPLTHKARAYPIGQFAGGKTVEQARNKAEDLRARIIAGEDPLETKKADKSNKEKTGADYLKTHYRQFQKNRKTGDETIHTIERHFAKLLKRPIAALTENHITQWQKAQQATGVKYKTVKRRFDAFKGMLNHADRNQYATNPIPKVRPERYQETPEQLALKKARRDMLAPAQEREFLAALDAYQDEKRAQRRNSRKHGKQHLPDLDAVEYVDHVKPIMLVLFYTGFRKGDAIGLRWENVNFDFKLISKVVEKTAHHKDDEQRFPIAPPLLEVLRQWHKQNGKPKTGLVFPSQRTGERLDETALQKPWKKIRAFAKLPEHLQLYSLRHNFASHLVEGGASILSVAKLLGHSDVSMIVEHYGHLQSSHLSDIANQFAARHSAEAGKQGATA